MESVSSVRQAGALCAGRAGVEVDARRRIRATSGLLTRTGSSGAIAEDVCRVRRERRDDLLMIGSADALAAGIDSPTLRVLAGAPRFAADEEATELAPFVFEELGLHVHERLSSAASWREPVSFPRAGWREAGRHVCLRRIFGGATWPLGIP